MSDAHTADEYRNKEVYDATGALLGTVAEVDLEEGVMYINPDPEVNEESWAAVGGNTLVNFDNNWLGIADYKVWNAEGAIVDDESDVGDELDPDEIEFDEWPYTLSMEYVDEVEADEIRLKH